MKKHIILHHIKSYFSFPFSLEGPGVHLYFMFSLFLFMIIGHNINNLILGISLYIVALLIFNGFLYGLFEVYFEYDEQKKNNEQIPVIKFLKINNDFLKKNKYEQENFYHLVNSFNVNDQNDDGDTILNIIAREYNHSPYIAYLLGIGANPYLKNNKNKCAFDYFDELYIPFLAEYEKKEIVLSMDKKNTDSNIVIPKKRL